MSPKMLSLQKAARYLGVSYQTLCDWRRDDHEPRLPAPVACRGRKLYVVSELDGFIADLLRRRNEPEQG